MKIRAYSGEMPCEGKKVVMGTIEIDTTQTDMSIEDLKFEFSVQNESVLDLVKHAKAIGSNPTYYINDAILLFHCAIKDIELPEFSSEEKYLIADCMCGRDICERFIKRLDQEVFDYTADVFKYFGAKEESLVKSRKDLINRIRSLNYMQRIKLIYEIQLEARCLSCCNK